MAIHIRRREFILTLGSAGVARPLVARAATGHAAAAPPSKVMNSRRFIIAVGKPQVMHRVGGCRQFCPKG
jgi:hypothetical protein